MGMKEENYQVSKSKGLLALSELDLTLNELKILDIYLSKIDPRSIKRIENETLEKLSDKTLTKKEVKEIIEKRDEFIIKAATVKFTREEYCKLLEIPSQKIRDSQLNKYIQHLIETSAILPKEDRYEIPLLFASGSYDKNKKEITLTSNVLSQDIKELFFDVGNYKYIKYRLKNTVKLTSIYSFKLYLYLLENRFRNTWEVDLEELRVEVLEAGDYYSIYWRLNDEILKKAHKEINNKTNLTFEYIPLREGTRKTQKIQFTCQFKDTEEILNGEFDEKEELPPYNHDGDVPFEYVISEIQEEFGRELRKAELKFANDFYELYGGRMMIVALNESAVYDSRSLHYMKQLLETWTLKGYTVEQVENGER